MILARVVYTEHAKSICNDSSTYLEQLPKTEEQTDIPSWEIRDLNENKSQRFYSNLEDIAHEESFTGTYPTIESPEEESDNLQDDDQSEQVVTTEGPSYKSTSSCPCNDDTIEEQAVYETNYSNENETNTDSEDARRKRSAQ